MVYVHVPFCRSFCIYCDFYSVIACRGKDAQAIEAYEKSLLAEIDTRRDEILASKGLNTLYIGGGTPSVLPLSVLRAVVERLDLGDCVEFTVEVNPDDVVERGESYVRALVELGVNRISMGVQSLDDGVLRWMRRRHDSAAALKAYSILRAAGIGNVSLDLIFGFPSLDDRRLEETVRCFVELRPEHISAYQLSVEGGSALAELALKGEFEEASQELCARQYERICRVLSEAGYQHYEISSWALPGKEAVHNSAYWERLPYVGLGPGAHSFGGYVRSANSAELPVWTSVREVLTPEEELEEKIMLALRTSKGVEGSLCEREVVDRLIRESCLEACGGGRLRIPENKFFVSDDIIGQLI